MNYEEIRIFDLSERERFIKEYVPLSDVRNLFSEKIIRPDDYPRIMRIIRKSLDSAIDIFLKCDPRAQSIYMCNLSIYEIKSVLYKEILKRCLIHLLPFLYQRSLFTNHIKTIKKFAKDTTIGYFVFMWVESTQIFRVTFLPKNPDDEGEEWKNIQY
jgi:hypothetical protein